MLPFFSRTRAARATDDQHGAERLASYPPPYPQGWYALLPSAELRDRPVEVTALGQRFVLFRRASDGGVGVLDAHCPHLGADLAQGVVRDDCLECPFHKWRFGADGKVASVPYAARTSSALRARAHPVEELHGFVCIYHGEGAPPYRPERVPAIDDGTMRYRGAHDAGIVRMHLIEFAENSADLRHFDPLHGDMLVPFTTLRVPGVRVNHRVRWELDADAPHVAWFHDEANIEVFGRRPEGSGATARIRLEGPGGLVRFDFQVRRLGRMSLFQTHTPVEPLAQRVRFRWYAEPSVPRPLVAYVVGSWIAQWRRDVVIWEQKVYRQRPMLVKEDGPVHALRRWYSQFYPPVEPTNPVHRSENRGGATWNE